MHTYYKPVLIYTLKKLFKIETYLSWKQADKCSEFSTGSAAYRVKKKKKKNGFSEH